MKPKFVKWAEQNHLDWKYGGDFPVGQQWGCSDNQITNCRGEGFRVHGGTKYQVVSDIIDALNKRDYLIAILTAKLKEKSK